jgi:hypothetical protein
MQGKEIYTRKTDVKKNITPTQREIGDTRARNTGV